MPGRNWNMASQLIGICKRIYMSVCAIGGEGKKGLVSLKIKPEERPIRGSGAKKRG